MVYIDIIAIVCTMQLQKQGLFSGNEVSSNTHKKAAALSDSIPMQP